MSKSKETLALIRAIKAGNITRVAQLIQGIPDLNETDIQGWTPLDHAADKGNVEMLKLLVRGGADVNHGLSIGFTALSVAVTLVHVDAVRFLLASGASLHMIQGNTMKNCVPRYGNREKCEKIIELLKAAEK